MAHPQAMLDAHPRRINIDARLVSTTIEQLIECANTCIQCADACLSEDEVAQLTKCIRLNQDCADVCAMANRVISRQTEHDVNVVRSVLEACIASCRSCGDECEQHAGHMEHCRICAESCRRCEEACSILLETMTS